MLIKPFIIIALSLASHFCLLAQTNIKQLVNKKNDTPKGVTTNAPLLQDYDITFTNVTDTSVTVNWKKGEPSNSILIMNYENNFQDLVNGDILSANTKWCGEEQVMFYGNGTSINITGLDMFSLHWFKVCSFNDINNPVYCSQISLNSTNAICTAPNEQAYFNSASATSKTINLSFAGSAGVGHIILMGATEFTDLPQANYIYENINTIWQNNGIQCIYNDWGENCIVTGLSKNTQYYFRIYEYNEVFDESDTHYIAYNTQITPDNQIEVSTLGDYIWTGNDTTNPANWHIANNWQSLEVPTQEDDVIIDNAEYFPVITNNAACKSITILPQGKLTVNALLEIAQDFNILSNASGSGSLVENNEGNIQVAGNSIYSLTLSPTSQRSVGILTDNSNVSQLTGCYTVRWDEATSSWQSLTTDDTLEKMKGYLIKYYNKDTVIFIGKNFNTGNQTIQVTNNGLGDDPDSSYGLNFIANPYPSAIDWNASSGWTRHNIDPTIYIYNNGTYETYNYETGMGVNNTTNGIVPAANGYYVWSTSPAAELSHNNNVRVHDGNIPSKGANEEKYQTIRLTISNSTVSDETAILIHPEATKKGNRRIDAFKLLPENIDVPQIYSLKNRQGTKYAMQSISNNDLLNIDDQKNKYIEIPIGFLNYTGKEITLSIKQSLDSDYKILLYDAEENNLLDFPTSIGSQQTINDGRYSILIVKQWSMLDLTTKQQVAAANIEIYSNEKALYVNSNSALSGFLRITDITGKEVYATQLNGDTNYVFENINEKGILVVTIYDKNGYYSKQLFLY